MLPLFSIEDVIIIIILFTYRNLQVSCSFNYLQRMQCLVYLCLFYDMLVANEAIWPVPNGVLLPFTTVFL